MENRWDGSFIASSAAKECKLRRNSIKNVKQLKSVQQEWGGWGMDGGRKRGLTEGAGEWEPMERTRSDNANEPTTCN